MVQKMLYIYNLRLPTEKAHGLQIVQNCEAFADEGIQVELVGAKRQQYTEFQDVDIYNHYGVKHNFNIKLIYSLDLTHYFPKNQKFINFLLYIQQISFIISAFFYLLFTEHNIIYTRDHIMTILAKLTNPRTKIAYEIHQKRSGRIGRFIQSLAIKIAKISIPITNHMKDDLIKNIEPTGNYLVAHDGVKLGRFNIDNVRSKNDGFFYVGYVGSISVMGMDKGVSTLIKAVNMIENCRCILIGGRQDEIQKLLKFCQEHKINIDKIIFIGQVKPSHVAEHLADADALIIPSPFNNFFAYYSSPLKLFEYMAIKKPIISSRLPAIQEIMTEGENILFFNPSDFNDLAEKIKMVINKPTLGSMLAQKAYDLLVEKYTWQKRAKSILEHLK